MKDQPAEQAYDLIIIGAGPIGMTVAIEAKKAGLSHLIIEKGMLVNTIFHFPTNMTFFSTSKLLEIGEVPFISHSEKPTRREALEYFRRVREQWDLNVHLYERVTGLIKGKFRFTVITDRGSYTARDIVVATGFYDHARMMDVPGEDLPKVKHYFDEAHPYVGQKVIVVGAANSACDVALELFHKGAEVTMVIRGDDISERVKYWIKPNIENRIKEGSIKAYFNSRITEIQPHSVQIQTADARLVLDNDFVLAMTGFQPDFDLLRSFGIEWETDGERALKYQEGTHESTEKGVFVAGVVCGGMKTNKFFIENAKDHAEKIIGAITARETS